ncbi:MAG: sigma-70 family RNA polymerase sigma factor [Acidobacteria bacterium]|nr:MAG: sigma-70 family RNA polymerase sigma factor [Acidobacteriota bacterium]
MGELTGSVGSRIGLHEAEDLVVRLREHDEQAFAEVFQLYKDLVYTLSVKLLSDKTEAMDITQEVFLTLFRKVHCFRGDCSLKTWLYRVTLNQAANRNRWWRRRFRNQTESLSLRLKEDGYCIPDPAGDEPWPDREVYAAEIHKALQVALNELPFDQRAAVVLRDVQGLSYEEVAEIVGAEIGTVKSRIARGRERLKDRLKPYREGAAL